MRYLTILLLWLIQACSEGRYIVQQGDVSIKNNVGRVKYSGSYYILPTDTTIQALFIRRRLFRHNSLPK